jgi:hypothetical protein
MVPAPWERLLWGTLPLASSILAIVLVLLIPERRRAGEPLEFPVAAAASASIYDLREAK